MLGYKSDFYDDEKKVWLIDKVTDNVATCYIRCKVSHCDYLQPLSLSGKYNDRCNHIIVSRPIIGSGYILKVLLNNKLLYTRYRCVNMISA